MIGNLVDRVIGVFSPAWAASRMEHRATMSQIQALTGGKGGYFGALGTNQKNPRRQVGNHSENAIDPAQFPLLANDAWEQFRTQPHFRKIVRALCSKVIGRGLMPQSLAMSRDGKPLVEFRAKCKQLWEECQGAIDYRGKPGQGGKTLAGIQHLALKTIMLSGETLFQMRPISNAEQERRSLPVPMTIQLIDPQRLADDLTFTQMPNGHTFYRGIELDAEFMRHRYWLRNYSRTVGNVAQLETEAKPYSASKIYHVFLEEDEDQLRGASWFAAALVPSRNGGDLRFNVVRSSAMQACIVLSYALASGKTRFGAKGQENADLTDEDGNSITHFSPGMTINRGKEGKVEMHSPQINISGYEGLIQSVARDEAAALPGTKSSTVTGDYRNSSFSSERSADNDIWPEIEVIQDWFSSHSCQPMYEEIVVSAVAEGYFDGVPGFNVAAFNANRASYLRCVWQGPVPRSINPVDDEKAAEMRLRGTRSSPQRECAKQGVVFAEVLQEIKEAYAAIKAAGLPEVVFNSMMGLDTQDLLTTEPETPETTAAKANDGSGNNVPEKQAA